MATSKVRKIFCNFERHWNTVLLDMDLLCSGWCRCRSWVYNWVQGLGIAPDVSHAVHVSAHKTEGNGVGDITVPPVKLIDLEGCRRWEEKPAGKFWDVGMDGWHLSVNVNVCDAVTFVWETVLIGRKLFVEVPKFILPDGSKERYGSCWVLWCLVLYNYSLCWLKLTGKFIWSFWN